MKIDYSALTSDGLVLYPQIETDGAPHPYAGFTPQGFFDSDHDHPEWVGNVPNFVDFAAGEDFDVGAFEIKAQGTRHVCLPSNLAHLLPTTKLIIDDLYAHAGAEVADQCEVSLQFFRRSYPKGEQLLFDKIHRHASEGKMVIYVVTAFDDAGADEDQRLGTEFYAPRVMGQRIERARTAATPADFADRFREMGVVAAPGGAIIRFSETTLHAAPDVLQNPSAKGIAGKTFRGQGLRRSLLNIIASHRLPDGTVYGRTRPPNNHRPSPMSPSGTRPIPSQQSKCSPRLAKGKTARER
ncbi:MAG: hypothetical protein ACLP8A_06510 [Methylovirgula sp.]